MKRLVTLSFVALAFLFFAAPAYAHRPYATGQTACADGVHRIDWLISHQAPNPMTIVSAIATVADESFAVGGYIPIVDPEGSTGATTDIPGDIVGTVTLTAELSWPGGFEKTVTATVELVGPCTVTTTTVTTTSTRPPDTTATTPPTAAPCGPSECLPDTGSDTVPLTVVGLGLIGTGALLAAGFHLSRKHPA